jgi:hypothetical protein
LKKPPIKILPSGWTLRVIAFGRRPFRGGDLGQRAAKVQRRRAQTGGVCPRDRCLQRVVELEDARAVPKALQLASVAGGQALAGDGEQLARGNVEEVGSCGGQLIDVCDPPAGADLAATGAQARGECVGERLGAAMGDRPTHRVTQRAEDEDRRGAQWRLQGQERVAAETRQERAGGLVAKERAGQERHRPERPQAEAGRSNRMGRQAQWVEYKGLDALPPAGQRRHQADVGAAIEPEPRCGRSNGSLQGDRMPAVQRVSQRRGRLDPAQAVALQVERAEDGRGYAEGVDSRAQIMDEPG